MGRGVDIKFPEYDETAADDFIQGDLRDLNLCHRAFDQNFDEVYQLAADMGGAGFVFTGENDAEIMHNSATINLNVLETCRQRNIKNIFYSSSHACILSIIKWILITLYALRFQHILQIG